MSSDLIYSNIIIPKVIPYDEFMWFINNEMDDNKKLDISKSIIHKLWNNIKLVEFLAIVLNTHKGLKYVKNDNNLKNGIIREIENSMRDISILWTINKNSDKKELNLLENNIRNTIISNKVLNRCYINDITSNEFIYNINKCMNEEQLKYEKIFVYYEDFMMLYRYLIFMNKFDKYYELSIKNNFSYKIKDK